MRIPPETTQTTTSPWPRRWAVALACATFPLIWVGGLVTTTDAGMAVPDWPTTYGYNLFLYPWAEWFFGPWDLFIEHGHRLLGAIVGLLSIGLLVVLWRCEARRWVRVFGLLLLMAVIGQGVLGGMRVRMNEATLAMVHGCTGPLFFAMCAGMAAVTSDRWRRRSPPSTPAAKRLVPLAAAATVLAYLQLVVGAQLRHLPVTADPSTFKMAVHLHLFLASVVLIHSVWLAVASRRVGREAWLRRPPVVACALILLQIGLGAATWIFKYGPPRWLLQAAGEWDFAVPAASRFQSIIVTAHVATGSLIVATALVALLRIGRSAAWSAERTPAVQNAMEAAL